jgi:hypothetical protein
VTYLPLVLLMLLFVLLLSTKTIMFAVAFVSACGFYTMQAGRQAPFAPSAAPQH